MTAWRGLLGLVLAAIAYASCSGGDGQRGAPSLRQDTKEDSPQGAAGRVDARERDTGLHTCGDGGVSFSSEDSDSEPIPNPTIVLLLRFMSEELVENRITIDDIFKAEQPIGAEVYESYIGDFIREATEWQMILEKVFKGCLDYPVEQGATDTEDGLAQLGSATEAKPEDLAAAGSKADRPKVLGSTALDGLKARPSKLKEVRCRIEKHCESIIRKVESIISPGGSNVFTGIEDARQLIGTYGFGGASADEINPGMFLPACRDGAGCFTTSDLIRPSLHFIRALRLLTSQFYTRSLSMVENMLTNAGIPTEHDEENMLHVLPEDRGASPLDGMTTAQLEQNLSLGENLIKEFMATLGQLRRSWESLKQYSRASGLEPQGAGGCQ